MCNIVCLRFGQLKQSSRNDLESQYCHFDVLPRRCLLNLNPNSHRLAIRINFPSLINPGPFSFLILAVSKGINEDGLCCGKSGRSLPCHQTLELTRIV